MRQDEPGTPLLFQGQVRARRRRALCRAPRSSCGTPTSRLLLPVRPGHSEWNLRGPSSPMQGQLPDPHHPAGPVPDPDRRCLRQLIEAAGWHAWRPAHLHLKVSAPGHELLTAQLYFPGDAHNDDDIASAVKPELMLEANRRTGGKGAKPPTTSCLIPRSKYSPTSSRRGPESLPGLRVFVPPALPRTPPVVEIAAGSPWGTRSFPHSGTPEREA